MKKIGILTFHRVLNDGSALQAYCLYKYLQTKFPEVQVEIIDYRPKKIETRVNRSLVTKRWPFWLHNTWKKVQSHHQFLKKNTRISSEYIVTDDLSKSNAFLKNQKYDFIFVGSDTVWDVRKNGGAPDVPNLYFLPNVGNSKKIAFAASMDKGEPEMVSKEVWNELIKYVDRFDFISVRDEATREKLSSAGILATNIHFMPDPTFLWDFSDISIFPNNFDLVGDNIAGVAVADTKLRKEMTNQLIKRGYQVVNLLGPSNKEHIQIPKNFSIENRIAIYSKLNFMITDRFHGSILTLRQSNAPVLLIEPSDYYPKPNSKGRDLFKKLDIEQMFWRCESYDNIPTNLIDVYIEKSKSINWPVTDRINHLENHGNKIFSDYISKICSD